jgi:hypothetical protein
LELYDVRIRDLLLKRMDLKKAEEVLDQFEIRPDVRELILLMLRHRLHSGVAISVFMENSGRSPYHMMPIVTAFHKQRDLVLERLLPYADTSPKLMGDHRWHNLSGGFAFIRYDVFMLENENYMVVDATIIDTLFFDHWKRKADERDREMFNKIHVYTLVDGDWVITYDDYAEQYRKAYAMMKNMTAFSA